MIDKLTKEQESRFSEFIDKWTRIGLSIEPANRKEAEAGVVQAYRIAGLHAPKIVWCGSPISQGLTRELVMKLPASVRASVRDSVGASVRASVWASVWDSVWDSVRDSVGDSVRDSVEASVGASVRDSGYGQHDANWVGFYDFFTLVLGLSKKTEKLNGINQITKNAGWWLPHKKLCWISERHCKLNRNQAGMLHKDEGAAVEYPDGWCIYALNGIRMLPEQVLTPAEKMLPEDVLREQNVDRRRELIRKVGIERMLAKLSYKSLEKRDCYELLSIQLSDELTDARYLRMVNPSVGTFHLEGVDPSCKTITESLNWRNKRWFENAEILT